MPSPKENEESQTAGPPYPASNCSEDFVSRVDIAEISDIDDHQSLSTSAVLFRCKQKFLQPYLRVLAIMGLRCFGTDRPNVSVTVVVLGYVHLFHVILFTVLGYAVQFLACFRRDQGICKTRDPTFGFVLPSALHFAAFVYALYLLRFKETEKLENLMERTFLLSAHRLEGFQKSHLLRRLWIFITVTILWLMVSLSSILAQLLKAENPFQFISSETYRVVFVVVLVLTTFWQDMMQATVITSYCLQAQLLIFSLHFLRAKLLQHTIQPLSWIREINECLNFLGYLNHDFSPAVCIFMFLNISWAVSDVVYLIRSDTFDKFTTSMGIAVACLWLTAAIAPFVMAAWLTEACTALRHLGHEVRIRPFVYQDTPGQDLDTILLYTSTLKLKSKLFGFPVEGRYVYSAITIIAFSIMVVGMNRLL